MLRIEQIKLKPGHSRLDLENKIQKILSVSQSDLQDWYIVRRSLDARKKPEIFYNYTVDVSLRGEENYFRRKKRHKEKITRILKNEYSLPPCGTEKLTDRPLIIGSGPAGLFCAYLLAKAGYRPILTERGAPIEERIRDVHTFWKTGVLNPASNVQFGEGGAGTFSDGKLNTLVKDRCGRSRFVLETLVRFGAPGDILYEQKPHIGTDILSNVVRQMREEICLLGGDVFFHTQITGLKLEEKNGVKQLQEVLLNQTERLKTQAAVFAIGHSARDTFQMLYEQGIPMQAKAFAVGVRIEHPQKMIQYLQYGSEQAEKLPPASYKFAEKLKNGRGVYTFCMCPGGYVINASSEEGRLAVNGMSYHSRNGENANSAVIVTVTPEDFYDNHPLSGVEFQRRLEQAAFREGNGCIPVQCLEDFQQNTLTTSFGEIVPQCRGKFQMANVRAIFPEELAKSLEEGICAMERKMPGFARPDALLSGVESRTSSPVRILRGESYESEVRGIYPCGEGAGYAGGITSAAMDGMKTAEAIIRRYAPE